MVGCQVIDKEARTGQASHAEGRVLEIHIKGYVDSRWSVCLRGLQMKLLGSDEMILAGYLSDQAALMGVLNKLNGLNLTSLSVTEVDLNDRH